MIYKALICGAAISLLGAASATAASPAMEPTNAAMTRGTAAQVPLASVTNAKETLASATIEDKDGQSVGTIHKIAVDANGHVTSIQADVSKFLGMGGKIVELDLTNVKYEADRNVLITSLTKPELEALPAAKP